MTTTTTTAGAIDRRRCPGCGKTKPLGAFYVRRSGRRAGQPLSRCKVCCRIEVSERRRTEDGRAAGIAYRSRPEVREASAERQRRWRRRPGNDLKEQARRQTVRARLIRCRATASWKLRRATDPRRQAALADLVAAYDRELARLAEQAEG